MSQYQTLKTLRSAKRTDRKLVLGQRVVVPSELRRENLVRPLAKQSFAIVPSEDHDQTGMQGRGGVRTAHSSRIWMDSIWDMSSYGCKLAARALEESQAVR
jgi:hypothetical protein